MAGAGATSAGRRAGAAEVVVGRLEAVGLRGAGISLLAVGGRRRGVIRSPGAVGVVGGDVEGLEVIGEVGEDVVGVAIEAGLGRRRGRRARRRRRLLLLLRVEASLRGMVLYRRGSSIRGRGAMCARAGSRLTLGLCMLEGCAGVLL